MEVGQLQFKFSLPSHPPHPLQIPLSCLHQHTTRLQLNHWLTAAIKASIFGRKCSPINKQIIIFSKEPAKGRNTKNLCHTALINVAENPQNWLTKVFRSGHFVFVNQLQNLGFSLIWSAKAIKPVVVQSRLNLDIA